MFLLRSTLLVVVLSLPAVAAAQDSLPPSDARPFRRGQWAAQFAAGFGFSSLGALHFTSPRRAWLFDASFSAGHSNRKVVVTTQTGDTTFTDYNSSASGTVRVGRRAYAVRGDQVVGFHTIGMSAGLSHAAGWSSVSGGGQSNGWNAGVFGDVGGTYLLTPRFSVGGTGAMAFSYSRYVSRNSGGYRYREWSYSISGPTFVFVATVYF